MRLALVSFLLALVACAPPRAVEPRPGAAPIPQSTPSEAPPPPAPGPAEPSAVPAVSAAPVAPAPSVASSPVAAPTPPPALAPPTLAELVGTWDGTQIDDVWSSTLVVTPGGRFREDVQPVDSDDTGRHCAVSGTLRIAERAIEKHFNREPCHPELEKTTLTLEVRERSADRLRVHVVHAKRDAEYVYTRRKPGAPKAHHKPTPAEVEAATKAILEDLGTPLSQSAPAASASPR
jgi:hypothetical protein